MLRQKGLILFSIKCDLSELKIKPWDLCGLTSNLLDNVLEAVLLNREKQGGLEINKKESLRQIVKYPIVAKAGGAENPHPLDT